MPATPSIPLRRLLLREGLLIVALAGAGLTLGAWWSTRRIMEDQAEAKAELGLREVTRRLETGFDEAIRTGEALARLWQLGRGPAPIGTVEAERGALAHLQSRAALCNITLADLQGRASAANAPAPAAPDIWLTRGGSLLRRWTTEGQLLSESPDPAAPPDWRERPWYRQALAEGHGAWTRPYPFLGAVGYGITYTLPARGRDGALLGVVGVDLLLGDLGPWLREGRPTPGSQVAVLEEGGTVLVPPEQDLIGPPEHLRAVLPTPLSAQAHPLVQAASLEAVRQGDQSWIRVESGGKRYLASFRPLRLPKGPQWRVLMAIPEADLRETPRQAAAGALGVSLAILALLAWRMLRASQKVEAPLSQLAAQGARLLDGKPLRVPATPIQELHELARCLRVASLALGEREVMEGQLRQAQRLELVGTLAAGVAHDLGNLLNAVTASLELAQDPRLSEDKRRQAMDRSAQAMRRAQGFIRALLTLGRPTEHTLASLDLNEPVGSALRLLGPMLGADILLQTDLASEPLPVMADPLEVEQVILNLGVNARDAMPDGGILLVRTSCDPAGRPVLEVRDTGAGIPETMRARLFTPFATTKGPGRGSGLGLAMVQGIARAHGAELTVDSEPGHGATFRLRFPKV